ncbi:MAG: undecaprenyldiphospho-muramoylpentapeptide beta-N-acetylglucosaminyltransferase [Candidatus Pacebacteria bacterium]|nr:undecaprenyldiphospho-muramoylpentapeptide beta-N-acetylglucosaminyltransferase [Candidatus Paceibacterota bacterium]
MKIVLTGGGTGGHVFPLIAISRKIKDIKNNSEIFYIGPRDLFTKNAFDYENIPIKTIFSGKIRRYFNIHSIFQNIIDIFFKIPIGFFQSVIYLSKIKPDFIFSKGGYGGIPVIFAGNLLKIPIFLHESDSIAGLANKIAGKFAKKIFVSFPIEYVKNLPKEKLIYTGSPIRRGILSGNPISAQKIFHLSEKKPILLILGGSQGSKRINTIIIENLDYLLENFEIIHQTGRIDYKRIVKYKNDNYHIYDFLSEEEIGHALCCADCIISRSGSSSIAEISASEKPSILIPLPESAQNHQVYNAYIYEKSKACIVIEEKDFTKEKLVDSIDRIMNPKKRKDFCKAAKDFAKKDADKIIAKKILEEIND